MKILVLGGTGQIGWELRRDVSVLGTVSAPPRSEVDLESADALRRCVAAARPDVVLNAAAYTAVDKAETERESCHAANAVAPGVLAEECKRIGALLVHYSTDYVFDGRSSSPYREQDATGPLNHYGATKLEGERRIQAAGGSHLILRTSWVYGTRGRNFMLTMLRLAERATPLSIVNDQRGSPTWSRAASSATTAILARFATGHGTIADRVQPHSGVYHMTAGDYTTWYDFARAIFDEALGRHGRQMPAVQPTTTADYGAPAPRPLYSVLDSSRLRQVFGIALPPWREQLTLAVDAIARDAVAAAPGTA